MKRKILSSLLSILTLLLILAATWAVTQTAAQTLQQLDEEKSHGYLFVAPGGVRRGGASLHLGGGGDAIFNNGGSAGAELGWLGPMERPGNGFGVFSLNGGYHFLSASRSGKAVPFVTAGYAGFFRSGYANGLNFGGGVNYWVKERIGVRLEFRDHVSIDRGSSHFLNARFGLIFR